MAIDEGDAFYFLTHGMNRLVKESETLPLQCFADTVAELQKRTEIEALEDDAAALCIKVSALPQSPVRQDGWPKVIRFQDYGDYQRFKGEVGKVLAEVTGKAHSMQEVAVHEALANAMECRDGVPRRHRARIRFNKVGNRLIVRVKSSRMGFAGNAVLRRLRSHPEDMFSFGEDASMGRGIPIMLSTTHKMTYNSEGTELLLMWNL
jgi:anti-sigma regulatory factor (Ser/Thr protein kinase)